MAKQASSPWEIPPREKGSWHRDHVRFLKEVLRYFALTPLTTLFVIVLMSVAIALPAGFWLIGDYVEQSSWVWPEQDGFNIFFQDSASLADIEDFAAGLQSQDSIVETTLITKEQALAEFLVATDLSSLINDLESNPLPNTLTVHTEFGLQQLEINSLVQTITGNELVSSVSYDPKSMLRFGAIGTVLDQLIWILSGTFCAFAVFVSSSAVRVSIQYQLQEIRVLHVMGAPKRLLRNSFLWCGAIYGIVSGYFASVLLTLVLLKVATPLQTLTESYGIAVDFRSLDWKFLLALVFIGLGLGLVGAYYATWRHIRAATQSKPI